MSTPPPPDAVSPRQPQRKPRRWLRRCAWSALLLACIVVVGGVVVTRSFVLTPLLSWQMSLALGVDVTLDRAEWSWDGRVDLIGVRMDLAVPSETETETETGSDTRFNTADANFDRLIDAERVAVSLTPRGWLRGDGVLDSIVIDGPVLRVVEDAATGRVNLRQWLAAGAPDEKQPDEAQPGVPTLPRKVQLRNGQIVVESRDANGVTETLADLPIAGRFEPMPDQPGTQRLVLEQVVSNQAAKTAAPPLRIEGMLTREPARIELRVDDFDVAAPLGVLAPDAVREFWAELNPAGALPTLRAVFERPPDMPESGVRLMQAELVLEGLEFSVPVEALGLDSSMPTNPSDDATRPADQPHDLRMTEVNGRFVLADDEVTVDGLTGLIEGVRYHVKGAAGLGETQTTRLQVHTEPFDLATDPPFILRLPRTVRNLYQEYRPSGMFRASAIIDHDPARRGRPVRLSGAVEVLGASATYHQFTYPLQDIQGVITFDENGVAFERLEAVGPTGAQVAIFGQVTNPGEQAAADVTIEMSNIPLDEHLYGALNAKAQRAIQMFLDTGTLTDYQERGLIGPTDADDASRYAFDLDNRGRGVVRIVRDLSVAPKSQVTTRIEAEGLRVLFEFFPYPLEVTDGALIISPERIGLEALHLQGPAGASATVVGELTREPGAAYIPNLTVKDMVVPITDNAFLLAALPSVAREWFDSFVLTGEARGQVRIFEHPETLSESGDDDVMWRVQGELVDGSARPFGGDYVVRDLSGEFVVDREHTELVGMTGRRGPTVLNVSANVEHIGDDAEPDAQPPLTLTATATNLIIASEVLDLIPPDLPVRATVAELFDTYEPGGATDVDLRITLPDADGTGVELVLTPREVALTNQATRVRATDMDGTVTVFGDHAQFASLRGRFPADDGGGFATIDGVVGLTESADHALSFAGRTTPGSPVMRAAVPTAGNTAIAALEIGGPVTVESARLLSRAQPDERAAVEFDATLLLADNTANLGLPITELDGTLQTSVQMFDDGRPTRLDLALSSPSLRASGRRVDRIDAALSNAGNADWLKIETLQGRLYGGMLNGRGGFPLSGVGTYRFSVSLLDAALGPVIDPTAEPKPDNRPAGDVAMQRDLDTGLVSAELTLAADAALPDRRSGSGAITVRNAKLFEARNSVAVLRVMNFALPSRQPLTGADIDFTLDGGLVRFRRLDLTGPGLLVKGGGTMAWPSTDLDLLLTTRNADAPTFGVFTEIFNALKDELVGIAVKGTLENPTASLTTLEGTRRAAGDILEPVLPVSPVAPKSPVVAPASDSKSQIDNTPSDE
ncbi:MAG: hypothetical protein AAF328_05940 [Planctomycetota bacterium]